MQLRSWQVITFLVAVSTLLVGIDEEAENAHILEAAKKLWGDLNHRTY